MQFAHEWLWLIFVGLGLILIIIEMVGLEMEFDLIFIGSGLTLGGLITWPFYNWIATVVVSCVILVAYVMVGRAYVHRRWLAKKTEKTNIDIIVGKTGYVTTTITWDNGGQVKVGYEEWRAKADEDIAEGEKVEVIAINGVTLTVKKLNGGN